MNELTIGFKIAHQLVKNKLTKMCLYNKRMFKEDFRC